MNCKYQWAFLGKVIDRVSETAKSLVGIRDLPTRVRSMLEKHGNELIKSITVYRRPLDKTTNTFANVLSLGNWEEIKRKAGVDQLFHTWCEIKTDSGTYLTEKNQTIELKKETRTADATAERQSLIVSKPVTLNELFEGGRKHMGANFIPYDMFSNNCQKYITGLLKGSGLGNSEIFSFLNQDVKKLIEETPSLSKYLAKNIVDFAGNVDTAISALRDKKGGVVPTAKLTQGSCWKGYHRMPGTKQYAKGSCMK
jgi:hypothetical protein